MSSAASVFHGDTVHAPLSLSQWSSCPAYWLGIPLAWLTYHSRLSSLKVWASNLRLFRLPTPVYLVSVSLVSFCRVFLSLFCLTIFYLLTSSLITESRVQVRGRECFCWFWVYVIADSSLQPDVTRSTPAVHQGHSARSAQRTVVGFRLRLCEGSGSLVWMANGNYPLANG
jgi:hypothetical protein